MGRFNNYTELDLYQNTTCVGCVHVDGSGRGCDIINVHRIYMTDENRITNSILHWLIPLERNGKNGICVHYYCPPPLPYTPGICYAYKGLMVNFENMTILLDGKYLKLPKIEFEILIYLARNGGRVVTYDKLIRMVWDNKPVNYHTIYNAIGRLRKILNSGKEEGYICRRSGMGYYLPSPHSQAIPSDHEKTPTIGA